MQDFYNVQIFVGENNDKSFSDGKIGVNLHFLCEIYIFVIRYTLRGDCAELGMTGFDSV